MCVRVCVSVCVKGKSTAVFAFDVLVLQWHAAKQPSLTRLVTTVTYRDHREAAARWVAPGPRVH